MQQALGRGPSSTWFGRLKASRKSTPLLSYLHQARHADEHGLERITAEEHGHVGIGVGGGHIHIERLEIRNGVITQLAGSQNGGPLQVKVTPPHLMLNRVENRGAIYHPPICPIEGEPYSAVRAAQECVLAMSQAADEARAFFT